MKLDRQLSFKHEKQNQKGFVTAPLNGRKNIGRIKNY